MDSTVDCKRKLLQSSPRNKHNFISIFSMLIRLLLKKAIELSVSNHVSVVDTDVMVLILHAQCTYQKSTKLHQTYINRSDDTILEISALIV